MTSVRDFPDPGAENPITMLTAYDVPTAQVVERAGIDAILVGDSLGNAVLGYDTTLSVTLDAMVHHTAAVARGVTDTLIVADMPFLSYGVDRAETVANAGRLLKEAGAHAVKLESGPHTVDSTRRLVEIGIPVQAHLGLTPQHVNRQGLERQGTDEETAAEIIDLAEAHAEAGAFSVVLEHIPANVAAAVTDAVDVPTIGIGAGPDTDGQILVFTDVVGLSRDPPTFAEQFGSVREEMETAVDTFRRAVERGEFPANRHSHVADDLDL